MAGAVARGAKRHPVPARFGLMAGAPVGRGTARARLWPAVQYGGRMLTVTVLSTWPCWPSRAGVALAGQTRGCLTSDLPSSGSLSRRPAVGPWRRDRAERVEVAFGTGPGCQAKGAARRHEPAQGLGAGGARRARRLSPSGLSRLARSLLRLDGCRPAQGQHFTTPQSLGVTSGGELTFHTVALIGSAT